MPTTPVQALPYPALSDPANGPVALQNLALGLEDYKTIIRCTSATRPAHVEGRVIYETDTDKLQVSNGTAWSVVAAPIDVLNSGDMPAASGWISLATARRSGNVVTLTLNIARDGTSGTGPANSAVITLPVGWRPGGTNGLYINGIDSASGGVTAMYLEPGGALKFIFGRAAGSSSYGYFTFVATA